MRLESKLDALERNGGGGSGAAGGGKRVMRRRTKIKREVRRGSERYGWREEGDGRNMR